MKPCVLRLTNPACGIAGDAVRDPDTKDRMDFENATPIGCGFMGAMLYGIPTHERILLNEEHIWSESQEELRGHMSGFKEKTAAIRALLLEGKGIEAETYAKQNIAFPCIKSYESAGELRIDQQIPGAISDYKRELDLLRGIAKVTYKAGALSLTETAFASYPKRVIVFRMQCDKERALSALLSYTRENLLRCEAKENTLCAVGKTAFGEHRFTVSVTAESDGKITADGGTLSFTNASVITLYIRINTDGTPAPPEAFNYDALLSEHTADVFSLMSRSDVCFSHESDPYEALPIPARIARIRAGETDHGILRLLFHFGRYLLVSSSRCGTLPANLQGIWSRGLVSPWNADYHTNVNLQMNYWLAEPTGLSECHLPLFDYMNGLLLEGGRRVAKEAYHCRGTVLHHVSDIYGFASAADGPWGLWPLGAAWLSYHLWEHYLYTGDTEFLDKSAYEYIHDSARFFLDYMFEKDGVLLSGPSASPENRYLVDGKKIFLALSPTMDVEIISGLLTFYIEAEKILHRDPAMQSEAERALAHMPKIKIGRNGTIREWIEDYEEAEPGHRHISHLFALYPGCMIDKENTPALFDAAKRTIERRLQHGGGHTGWSAAWILLFYARLLDGVGTENTLRKMISSSILDNLFDSHPPFQIDGNFGVAAGIAEMLLQSHNGHIRICPALPVSIKDGAFYGLCARGGVTVDAAWQNGRVVSYTLKAKKEVTFRLSVNESTADMHLDANEIRKITL